MKILVTGCAGFIGYHICLRLLKEKKYSIVGIDNLNEYYDIELKKSRLNKLKKKPKFTFRKLDICNKLKLKNLFQRNKFDKIIHLAAQAGVRYSILNPQTYFDNNLSGFFNIIDNSRVYKIKHLIFASSSSVYGSNKDFPLKEKSNTDEPLSFYAATKKSNEILAHSYANIYSLPVTGLRFFTVFGPYGRPDMALFLFAKAMITNSTINLFNRGHHVRDFTYIDDVCECLLRVLNKVPKGKIPYEIYNIGSNKPKKLKNFLNLISKNLNIKPKIKYKPLQKGDVYKTHASINKISKRIKYKPNTQLINGIKKFIDWYKNYYQ